MRYLLLAAFLCSCTVEREPTAAEKPKPVLGPPSTIFGTTLTPPKARSRLICGHEKYLIIESTKEMPAWWYRIWYAALLDWHWEDPQEKP